MATILGPTVINERNHFMTWSDPIRALVLNWSSVTSEFSIPLEKLEKIELRVCKVVADGVATETSILKLLGSLPHVRTCCPPARSFFRVSKIWLPGSAVMRPVS
ncbi:hypothetical protein JG688_00008692 [Phytophthora aleatoria]|uniref:Uncharacterized protein n=1 Tax=Phytophthora aleatoria TaxID=2496075 RepID=A0A8J5MFM1_9STRA|nr:hypothetical protein JG688_00008692 [Phytophthora aleatoria]